MDQQRKCNIDKITGLPVGSIASANVSEQLALRNTECGKPASHKVTPRDYACEEHAERLRSIQGFEVAPI